MGATSVASLASASSSSAVAATTMDHHHRQTTRQLSNRSPSRRRRNCCCRPHVAMALALLTVAAAAADVASVGGGGMLQLASAAESPTPEEAHLYESVSAEPLTFEPPSMEEEPMIVDRARLLAEEAEEEDYDWIAEDYEDGDEEEEEKEKYGTGSYDSNYNNLIPYEDYVEDFEIGKYHTEEGDYEMLEGGGEEEEEENEYDNSNNAAYENEAELLLSRRLRRRLDNPIVEDNYLTKKDSFRDESIPIFEPDLDGNGKFVIQFESQFEAGLVPSFSSSRCGPNQRRATIRFDTDDYGHETSWKIVRENNTHDHNIGGLSSSTTTSSVTVATGPPTGYRYADNRQYIGTLCLNPGRYRFEVHDKFNDGMCGALTGAGLYRLHLGEEVEEDDDNSIKRFASPSDCSINWGKRVHSFTIQAHTTPAVASLSSQRHQNVTSTERELGGCSYVKIQFKIDKYGKETTVTLTGNGGTQLVSRREVGAYQTKTMQKCVNPGTYSLRLTDTDGICCGNGKGWYKMYVDGHLVVSGGYFIGSKTHTVKIGTNWQSSMSYRDREWLNAHNARRRRYNGGNGYVPLRWSRTLAADAKNHANRLGNNCKSGALYHAQGVQDGENLAKNQGRGSWGRQYAADNVMGRWVEQELNWSYPKNAHYTQVVWRATQYVGCGESVRNYGNGYSCRVQVCRYIRAGNCGVRNGNWRAEAWKDDTQCGSICPREGCFV